MKTSGLSKLVIMSAVIAITVITAYGYSAFRKDVAAMQSASMEDITWTSTQLELELGRFRESMALFLLDGSETTAADVNNRFDILWSRIALFQQGRVGERLAEYDKDTQIVSRLFQHMRLVDRRIVGLEDTDKREVAFLLYEFIPFSDELRGFNRLVTLGEETRGREIREQLQSGVNRTSLYGAIAILGAFAALIFINRESTKFKRLAATNLELADKASRASRAKSQFLSMMSHELRTPMNGVLGLLALSKQSAVQPSQLRLIEQAEVSGNQMVGLLSDIMDFSVLQSDTLILDKKPFEISFLGTAVQERFEPLAKREGISFTATVGDNCPKRILGDFRRLRQAFSHLAQYIVETAGAGDIQMHFKCVEDQLVMSLSFDYLSSGGEWTPDLILGEEIRDGDKFATDALGPAIARGYIEAMNGSIRVDNPSGERIAVVAAVPVEEFNVSMLNVTVLSNSNAMAAICRAALQSDNIEFTEAGEGAHVVLIESGNSSESGYIKQATEQCPNALLIALGSPVNREAFDFSIDLPLDFHELREVVQRQIA